MYDEEWFQGRDDDTYDSPIRYNSYDTHLCIEQFMSRTEQWTRSTQKPDRPNPTRKVLGGSKNIRVGFRVLISGYFRIRVGIRSYISYFWTQFFFFFFWKNLYSLLVKYFQQNKNRKWESLKLVILPANARREMNKKRQERDSRSMLWFWTSGSKRNRACEKVNGWAFNFPCWISRIVCIVNESKWVSFSKRKRKRKKERVSGWEKDPDPLHFPLKWRGSSTQSGFFFFS